MSKRYRSEKVSAVPSGWRVRTVSHHQHRMRVAFPPGRPRFGNPKSMQPGRLVSVLHPINENPCTLRSSNPAELLVLGANPPRSLAREKKAQHQAVRMYHRMIELSAEGKTQKSNNVRMRLAHLNKKMNWTMADVAGFARASNPGAELLVMAANPGVHTAAPGVVAEAAGNNPPAAAEIYEKFSGRESEFVNVESEPHIPRGDYAQLGKLLNLYVKPVSGGQVLELRFKNDKPTIVCDASARQMYFVKGDQDISAALDRFDAEADRHGIYELGEGVRIDYQARKDHVAEPDEDKWKHYFGEENGAKPTVLFDSRHKRILLDGGAYRIDGAWIRN